VTITPLAAAAALLTAATLITIGNSRGYPIPSAFTVTGAMIGAGIALGGGFATHEYVVILGFWFAIPIVEGVLAYGLTRGLRSDAIPETVGTGLYSTLLQARLMDTEKLSAYQERMARLKERKAAAKERDDDDALERIQREQVDAAGDQLGMVKLQFRPMVWIMLLTIPVFLWLRWKVRGGHLGVGETGLVVPLAGAVFWQDPLLGPMSTWIV